MDETIEKLFASCLLAGSVFSLLFCLAGSSISRLRRFGAALRLPRLVPRLRRPRVRVPGLRFPRRGLRLTAGAQPWVAPLLAGLLMTLFGAAGLMLRILAAWSATASLVGAGAFGLAAALAGVWLAGRWFAETAEQIQGNPLLLTVGHVSVAVPQNGTGAIAFVAEGKRVSIPARSHDGHPLRQGTRVIVVDRRGPTAIVEQV
jgi:membrane protein implicated in regulation of membrane protease activity